MAGSFLFDVLCHPWRWWTTDTNAVSMEIMPPSSWRQDQLIMGAVTSLA
jgi:hypothetical protein